MKDNNQILSIFKLFFIILISSRIFGQIEITNNFSIDDGLAYSQVNCAYKDNRGVMWFGTTNGLSEWNSLSFSNFSKLQGLPSNNITTISEDENNILFIGTTKGLAVLKSNSLIFTPIDQFANFNIVSLLRTAKGDLYILTKNNGVWLKSKNGFLKIDNKTISQKLTPTSIIENQNGEILIGTKKQGIFKIINNKLSLYFIEKLFKKYPIVDLLEENKDSLYVALKNFGVVILGRNNTHTNFFLTNRIMLPNMQINDLASNSKGSIYAATSNGVAVIKNEKVVKLLTGKNGLFNKFINKIFFLNEGTIFFLSNGSGFFIYRPDYFLTFNKKSGLPHNNVWAIKQLWNGDFCFLTDEGPSIMHKNKFLKIDKNFGLGSDLVLSVFETQNHDLYLGTFLNGVILVKNGKVIKIDHKYGMLQSSVWSIQQRKNGNLLFVTHTGGIAEFDGEKIIDTLDQKNGLPGNVITCSFKRKNGMLLFGVENSGLYFLNGKDFVKYSDNESNLIVWDIYEDIENNLYLGTDEKGIIRISKDNYRDTISVLHGLSNNTVVAITGDNYNNIYAATDHGLNVINFSDSKNTRIKNIFKKSGLASSECNQNAIYKDTEGNIWVGTIGGVTRINPNKIYSSKRKLHVYITKIEIFDKEIYPISSFEDTALNSNENDISFSFANINYAEPGVEKYKYKLTGVDKKWFYSEIHKVRYSNLAAGNYTFSLSASNEWGIWSEPVFISFIISQPVWKTWWFITFSILLLSSIVYSIFHSRVLNLLKLERLRTKISADLHDEIGSGLSEISILSELLKFNKVFDNKLIAGLDNIGESTRELIDRLSDIIWIVNPRKETLKDLISRISDNYLEVFYHSEINFSVNNLEVLKNLVLSIEVKQNLYLIIKEAVNNSVKHSECSNITIDINNNTGGKLFFDISDDGKGINKINYEKGNGIFNMKRRADLIDSTFQIVSDEKGTKIKLELLLKKRKRKWLK